MSSVRKICPRCGTEKDIVEFARNKTRRDGLQKWCRNCHNSWRRDNLLQACSSRNFARKWYEANKEKVLQKQLEWKRNNAEKHNAHTLLGRQKISPQVCSVLGCNSLGEKHHKTYNNIFDFIWLCRKHHVQTHKKVLV